MGQILPLRVRPGTAAPLRDKPGAFCPRKGYFQSSKKNQKRIVFAAGTFTRYLIEVVFFPSLKLSFPTHLNCFFNPIEVVFSPSFKLSAPPFKRCFPHDLSGGFPRFKGCFPPNLSGIFAVVAASQGQERNRVRWGSGTHPKPAPPARAWRLRGMRRTRVSSPPSLVSRFWGRGEKLKEFGGGRM